MVARIEIELKSRGVLADFRALDKRVQREVVGKTMKAIDERLMRKGIHGSGGKGLGVQRNIVQRRTSGGEGAPVQTLGLSTTKRQPRNSGKAWRLKQIRIVRAMLPRVLKKRVQEALGAR